MSDHEMNLETHVVQAIVSLIRGGFSEGQIALAKTAADQCGVSIKYAFAVLQKYTGRTGGSHYWSCRQGRGGRRLYALLSPA